MELRRPLPATLAVIVLLWLLPAVRAGVVTNLAWRWSNPRPFGMQVAAVTEVPGERFVVAGDFGQLYTSDDLVNWERSETGTRRWLRAVRYFDPDGAGPAPRRLVVTGESGTVLVGDATATEFLRVDLGTADWLEDLAAATNRLVAVGDRAAIYTSDDGTNWLRRAADFTEWLRGVAWRPDGLGGGLFVAVGEGGRVASSPDGITWTRRSSGVTTALNRVAALAGGFLAVGDGGVVLQGDSAAATWRRINAGTTASLYAAAQEVRSDLTGSPTGVSLVAGDGQLRSLLPIAGQVVVTDETQVQRPAPAPRAPYYAAHWTGTEFLVGGAAGLLVSGVRPSLISAFSWQTLDRSPRRFLFDIASLPVTATNVTAALVGDSVTYSRTVTTNVLQVAVGDGPIVLTSDTGVDWELGFVPATHDTRVYLGASAGPGGAVAVGSGGVVAFSPIAYQPILTTNRFTNGTAVVTALVTNQASTLGIAWYAVSNLPPVSVDLRAVTAGPDRYVACGGGGTLLTSTNGTHWSQVPSPVGRLLNGVAAHPGGFVAVGENGTVLRSPDGTAWTEVGSGVGTDLARVRWTGGRLVAVGEEGVILTSPDGLAWTRAESGTTAWLQDVAHAGEAWYAAGSGGVVVGSSDTTAWVPVDSLTTQGLFAASARGGQLTVGGAQGLLLRAWPGGFPDPVRMARWPQAADQSVFLFTGTPDQRFSLARGTNLTDWSVSPPFEIVDDAGTLILVDPTPNDPVRQFFRLDPLP